MDYDTILEEVVALLQQQRRLSYRVLKLRLQLDADTLEALKEDLIYAKHLAKDEDGRVLVWTGAAAAVMSPDSGATESFEPPDNVVSQDLQVGSPSPAPRPLNAERRQLTVLFCDLVDSTALARHLDPEDYREVVRAYQATCAAVIQRFDGHIAQYLGDGLLVYFGYPQAHEDDPQRAVRAGLEMLDALAALKVRLTADRNIRLAVRLGIHTGLVVVGAMGTGGRQEALALGDTPNVAARLQGRAAPDTLVVSEATWRLVQGYFADHALGPQALKGVERPVQAYQVLGTSGAQSRLDVVPPRGLTPLVGREAEVALLCARWAQARDGLGQVVVLSGEAGIGKSRLVQVLHAHVATEPHVRVEWRCSPYAQQSPLHPVIAHLYRLLRWPPDETPEAKLRTLEETLAAYGFALPETVPLFAALLALPLPERYPPPALTPQRQRQKTFEALLTWLLADAARQPVLFIIEDVHWIDPSTLEFLTLLIDQGPTARLLTLLTCRPEFQLPWGFRAHLTPLTLSRLPRPQVAQMSMRVAGGKALPPEVVEQIVVKTDGVPLFVEELTKMVLESGLLQEGEGRYDLTGPLPPLSIPATLQDSFMARLDRLATVKAVAQLGATIGRAFAYDLIQAVSPLDESTLQQGLRQLVEVELLYQRGSPPQATYTFKHALIQETAYQSLLKSTRQQFHQRLAQALENRFPATAAAQPELLAHHYTEAGLIGQAIPYWRRAGERAIQGSANVEAISHLTKGLELLATLPETLARAQQELDFLMALGPALMATQGPATLEVEQTYARTRALCQQIGETPQLFSTLWGLCRFYRARGALPTARELGEQLDRLAQREAAPTPRLEAHDALGSTLFHLVEYAAAQTHLEQGIALTDPTAQRALALRHDVAPGVTYLAYVANILWCLGFPAQGVGRSQEALAQTLSHPYSRAFARYWAALLHHRRREAPAVQAQADALLTLATAQGFPLWGGLGTCWQGWALAMQGQGLAVVLAARYLLARPLCLVLLGEAAGHVGQGEEGLRLLAETYRLQGELLLRQAAPDAVQAEACFQQAIAVASHQQAKSWELRAAMSLSRLWQQQSKRAEAYALLAPIYGWFTEGFDTADLKEAKALLEELS